MIVEYIGKAFGLPIAIAVALLFLAWKQGNAGKDKPDALLMLTTRLDAIERGVSAVDSQVKAVDGKVTKVDSEIANVRERVARIEGKLDL